MEERWGNGEKSGGGLWKKKGGVWRKDLGYAEKEGRVWRKDYTNTYLSASCQGRDSGSSTKPGAYPPLYVWGRGLVGSVSFLGGGWGGEGACQFEGQVLRRAGRVVQRAGWGVGAAGRVWWGGRLGEG